MQLNFNSLEEKKKKQKKYTKKKMKQNLICVEDSLGFD